MADLQQKDWTKQLENDTNAEILDVRTAQEIEEFGMIPNATNIDIYAGQAFIDEIQKLDNSKSYYVYCRSGNRSGQACALMNQLGFEKAYNLVGGFNDWEGDVNQ